MPDMSQNEVKGLLQTAVAEASANGADEKTIKAAFNDVRFSSDLSTHVVEVETNAGGVASPYTGHYGADEVPELGPKDATSNAGTRETTTATKSTRKTTARKSSARKTSRKKTAARS